MKKAILILIAGLLLSSNAYAGSNYIGMDFTKFKKNFFPTTLGWTELRIHNTYPKYMHSGTGNSMYLSRNGNKISYGFESRTQGKKGYKLTKIFNNNLEAIEYYLSLNPTNQETKAKLHKWKAKQISGGGSQTDKQIAKARSICEKIGVTPGTDKFIDCTIKMMSTSTGQQTVIVGSSQRRSIYPLHCRQMGGASNC